MNPKRPPSERRRQEMAASTLPPAPKRHRWRVIAADPSLVTLCLQRRTLLGGWRTVDCTIGYSWDDRSALAALLLRRHGYRAHRPQDA